VTQFAGLRDNAAVTARRRQRSAGLKRSLAVRGRVPKGRGPTDNRKRNRRAIAAGLAHRPSSLLAAYEREKSLAVLVSVYLPGNFTGRHFSFFSLSLSLSLYFILSLLFTSLHSSRRVTDV